MPAGQRDQRIRFQKQTRTPDGGGGFATAWDNRHPVEVRASVEPASGREALEAMQAEGRTLYRVTIPNRIRDVLLSDRIVWTSNGGMILNIRELGDAGPREIERTLVAEAAPELQAG